MALPEEVQSSVEQLELRLQALEAAVAPLLEAPTTAGALQLDALERAQLQLTLGHAAAALFITGQRCRGTVVGEAQLAALERVNRYTRAATEHGVAPPRIAGVDRAAAGRFIHAALGRAGTAAAAAPSS